MARATPGLINFNAGALSPNLIARTDLQKYPAGAATLQNYIPTIQGPIRKRPGTRYIQEIADSTKEGLLTPFRFNVWESFVLEWGDHTLRFYQNRAPVLSGPTPYEITTPYAYTDLFDSMGVPQLMFAQSADVVYICHRSTTFPVYKLEHFGTTNWVITEVNFIGGPFAPANPGTNPIVYASGETGSITLYASSNIFDPDGNGDLIGAQMLLTVQNLREVKPWEVQQGIGSAGIRRRYNGVTYEAIDGNGSTPWQTGTVPPTHIYGAAWDSGHGTSNGEAENPPGVLWEYRDPGYGYATITAIGAAPTGAQVAITGITQAKPPVVTLASVPAGLADGSLVFITGVVGMTEVNDKFFRVSGLSGTTFNLKRDQTSGTDLSYDQVDVDSTNYDPYMSGGTLDNRIYSATVSIPQDGQDGTVNRIPRACCNSQNATSNWAVSTWNIRDGYPACVAFTRGRLAFARDNDIEFSVSQDFENFSSETPNAQITDDMGISIQVPQEDPIQWLQDGQAIVAGSASNETLIAETNPSAPFSPTNVATRPGTTYGSRGIQAVSIGAGPGVVFVQATGYKLRMIRFNFYVNTYDGPEVSAMADEIMLPNVTQAAYQKEPDGVLWFVRSDGVLIGVTYKIESQGIGIDEERVIAWHEHPMTNGSVESICSIPAPDGTQDDLWMIVNRTINGVTKRYVELMAPHFLVGNSLATQALYLDCMVSKLAGVSSFGTTNITLTGLTYLEGQTVGVLVDGTVYPSQVVSGGQIVVPNVYFATAPSSKTFQVGIPKTNRYTSMPLEAGSTDGTAQGKIKRVSGVRVRLRNAAGSFQVGAVTPDNEPYIDLDTVDFRRPSDDMDAPVAVFNGFYPFDKKVMPWPTGYEQEARLTIEDSTPLPMTIVGVYPILDTNE